MNLSFHPPPSLRGSQRGVKRSTGQGRSLSPPLLISMTIKQLGIKGGQILNLSIVMSSWEVRLSLCICFYLCRSVRPFYTTVHCHFTADIYAMQIGPFLTLLGPRNLPALSHQMYHWLSNMWETASLSKNTGQQPFFYNCIIAYFSVIFHLIFNGLLFTYLAFGAILSIFISCYCYLSNPV